MSLGLNFKKLRYGAKWIAHRWNHECQVPEEKMLLLFRNGRKACGAGTQGAREVGGMVEEVPETSYAEPLEATMGI